MLDCGGVATGLRCDDPAVIAFAVEYFDPWFRPTRRAPEWSVTITSTAPAYAEMRRDQPADAAAQACFAHDRQVLSMPAWRSGAEVIVRDADRSCFLRIGPRRVDLVVDPATRRWRFTLLWILQEIAATRLRRTHVDLHAASVETGGRALLVAGPKKAGKTTLSFHLLRCHGWRSIANDRSFVGGEAPVVAGMPTVVKILSPTLDRHPELVENLPPVSRPYLYTLAELREAGACAEPPADTGFALTPNQIALRLGAGTRAAAPLGAVVFTRIRGDGAPWALEPMAAGDIAAAVRANLYGAATGERPATLFEEFGDGRHGPPPRVVARIATGVDCFRLRLGPDAYAGRTLGERLRRLLATR